MKEFKTIMLEEDSATKEMVLDELETLAEMAETELELSLLDLMSTFVEEGMITEDAYDAIYDLNEVFGDDEDDEASEHEIKNFNGDDLLEVVAAFKKRGYVKCPNGKIRKRGNCGKTLDRKRSKQLKKFRKSGAGKLAFRKAGVRAVKTKKRKGQL